MFHCLLMSDAMISHNYCNVNIVKWEQHRNGDEECHEELSWIYFLNWADSSYFKSDFIFPQHEVEQYGIYGMQALVDSLCNIVL